MSIEIPAVLYKYRADKGNTERILRERSVWLSNAEQMNDPFECAIEPSAAAWAEMELEAHTKDVNDMLTFLRQFPDKTRVEDVCSTFHSPADMLKNVGIFSLSAIVTSPTMWAHYGEDGRGIAFGFFTQPATKLFSWEHVIRVEYHDEPIGISEGQFWAGSHLSFNGGVAVARSTLSLEDPTVRRVLGTKSTSWSYEHEWRYVELAPGEYAWPGPLVQVVFGWACPEPTIDRYRRLAEEFIDNPYQLLALREDVSTKRLVLESLHG